MLSNKKNNKILLFNPSNNYSFFITLYYAFKLPKGSISIIWDWYCYYTNLSNNINFVKKLNVFRDVFSELLLTNPILKSNKFLRIFYRFFLYGRFSKFHRFHRYIEKNIKSIASFFVFSDIDFFSYPVIMEYGDKNNVDKYIPITFLDEGSGAYAISNDNAIKKSGIKAIINDLYYKIRGTSLPKNRVMLTNSYISNAILSMPNKLPNVKKKQFNIIKQNKIFTDTEFINYVCNKLELNDFLDFNKSYKYYLYLGSPIEETDVGLSFDADVEFINKIISYLEDDEKLIIKFHPHESRHKYDKIKNYDKIIVLDFDKYWYIPVELLATTINPLCIFSMMSSGAYNLLNLGIKTKVIYNFPYYHMKNMENFRKVVESPNIYFLEKIEDFEEIKKKDFVDDPNIDVEDKDEDLEFMRDLLKV